MGNTVKATFTLPKEIMDVLIEISPINERSRTVAQAIEEFALTEKRKKAINNLIRLGQTLKWKSKKTAVEMVREARKAH